MQTITNSASEPAHYSYVEKKSEFIGDACHIDSLDDALAFVEQIRSQHPKSRHVCYAAITGASEAQFQERMSDDGEPSGTAGKPILQVLRQSGTTDTVVAVTRYFGGILLGVGGLVRAYSTAASEALKVAQISQVIAARNLACTLEYSQLAVMERIISQIGGRVDNQNFTDKVFLEFTVPEESVEHIEQTIEHTFQATVKVSRGAVSSLMK